MGAIKNPSVARWFATEKHHGQMYGQHPYSFHLEMAVTELREHVLTLPVLKFYDHDVIECATWLHDVKEDTGTPEAEMRQLFLNPIVDLVMAVTDGPGKNRRERKAHVYKQIRDVGPAALAVKLADRLANAKSAGIAKDETSLLQMYRREQSDFELATVGLAGRGVGFGFEPVYDVIRGYLGMEPR